MKPLLLLFTVLLTAWGGNAADTFEVASVKANKSSDLGMGLNISRGRFFATNIRVRMLIRMAYGVQDFQITGAPGWIDSDRFDIEAKTSQDQAGVDMGAFGKRLQALLEDRFRLSAHRESKEAPIYALVVAKSGPKMTEISPLTLSEGEHATTNSGSVRAGKGELTAEGATLDNVAVTLTDIVGRKVMNETGLRGKYNFHLNWNPDDLLDGSPDGNAPSLFSALQEQLGLKLELRKGAVDLLVIDHIERPSAN